ncbi:MAG: hypothetical protein QXR57_03555 [Metallosphaera sp.]|uniref:hypothetical protein n=1 Tax=Metallosphaera sp. TaxID=2020860 RepID=UPI0031634611
MLPLPEDGFDIIKKIKLTNFELPKFSTIVYGYRMDLPAYTLLRGKTALSGDIVKILNVYDFLYLDVPYSDNAYTIFLLNEDDEIRDIDNVVVPLNAKGVLITCREVSSRLKKIVVSGETCELNASLSIISWLTSIYTSPRSKRLQEEIDLSDVKDWLQEKIKQIDIDLDLLISPTLSPSLPILRMNLGKKVKTFYENDFSDSNVIYTGVDFMVGRKLAHSLRSKNMKVKEVQIDTDPLTAPIYLSIMSYILKDRTRG